MRDSREQAKQVLCLILAAAGGKLNKKVALYKAFYFAHLYYWKNSEGMLTDYPIVKMPQGPGIDEGTALLHELAAEGKIIVAKEACGPYSEDVYTLTENYPFDRNGPRFQAVEAAVEFIKGKSAAELSEITHEYSRTWQNANVGEELSIYLDLLDDDDYLAIQTRLRETEEMVNRVFA